MVIAFRSDASMEIGTGHISRCLTLANMLREHGVRSHFICRAHHGHMAEKIESEGHEVTLLPLAQQTSNDEQKAFVPWLGAVVTSDINETLQCLRRIKPSWLVADHFYIDNEWESGIKDGIDIRIMVIDGLANRKHVCDLLLDQTHSPEGERRWKGLVPTDCKLFVGPKFALLRPEFHNVRKVMQQRTGTVNRILIAFGGVDQPNATSVVLDAVVSLNRPDISVDVVIGNANPHLSGLKSTCQVLKNVQLHVQTSRMAELCAAADLAIGGGGTMTWERCYLGLPTLIISIAENQVKMAQALQSTGAVIYLGDISCTDKKFIRKHIKKLIKNHQTLKDMQVASKELMSTPDTTITQSLLKTA